MNSSKAFTLNSSATGLLLALAPCLGAGTANAQTTETWTGAGGTSLWNLAGNWSGGVVPDNGVPTGATYNAIINNGSAVTFNLNAGINNLTVASGNSLAISNGDTLTISGSSISNGGTVSVGSAGNATVLVIGAPNVTLNGGGTVTLSNNANNYIQGAVGTDTLTNQETISGAGQIGHGQMTLVNSGTINSNGTAGMIINASGNATGGNSNTGTIEATAGSTLQMVGTYTNTGGTFSATGAGSTLLLAGATLNGGAVTLSGASLLQLNNGLIHGGSTLTNSATGVIEALGGSDTLGGTIVNPAGGVLKIDNGVTLNLEAGSYPTLGAVQLNSTGNATVLQIPGSGSNVTLSGGTVTLSNNANNYIQGAAGTDTLTNQETISGAGQIGHGQMTLVNSGTINSNGTAGMIINASGNATGGNSNTGTIEATAGSTLQMVGTYTNTGGTFSATGAGSTLLLAGATLNGGAVTLSGASLLQLNNGLIHGGSTLTNSATGVIEALGGSDTLGGTIVNPAGGVLKIDNGVTLNLEAGSYPTLGAVQLNSTGNATVLQIPGSGSNVTLSGGTVTLSNNANNYIQGAVGTDTLTNQETISGAGQIGHGQMTLVNSGTINSNGTAGMIINASGNATGGNSNTGTIEATAGSTLQMVGTYTNTGGTFSATGAGSTLLLAGATLNGGAVTLSGASLLQLNNGLIHGGSTLTNSATGVIEALGGSDTLGGTIVNPAGGVLKIDNGVTLNLEAGSYPTLGAVQLNSTGNATVLQIPGSGSNVTLSGGTVTLSNNANNYIQGAAGTDTLTNQETISGAGQIGHGQMTLVNSGTINSNGTAGMIINASGNATGGNSNTGTIEATAGSTLQMVGTYTNTGGTFSATGAGSTLLLAGATLNGGAVTLSGASLLQLNNGLIHGGSTLTNSATGVIEALGGSDTLGGTIVNPAGGVLKIDNGVTLNLEAGSYPTLGAVQLNSTGNATVLQIPGSGSNVTLSGGTVTLSNNANNYIQGAVGTDTLTNQETISGAGQIGHGQMTLVNSGTINSNGTAGMIINASGSLTNSGTLMVGSGDVMHTSGGTFTNFAAGTLTGGTYNTAGTLEIDQLGSTGGEIVTNAANIILNGTGSSFVDSASKDALSSLATNAAASSFSIQGGRNFTTAGNFTNNGTLSVGAGSVFAVGSSGLLTNFSGTTLTGGIYIVNGTLQFPGANIVTNAANVTLTGASSSIVNSSTSTNGLANFATNAAAGRFTLAGGRSFTTVGSFTNAGFLAVGSGSTFAATGTLTNQATMQGSGIIGNAATTLVNSGTINSNASPGMTISATGGGATNTGTLEATAGSTLTLSGMTVANTGGTLSANGSKLQLTNSTVNGGAVTLTGASRLLLANGTIHGGSTLTNSTTGTIEAVSGTNTLGGAISNPAGGVVKIDNGAILNLESGSYLASGAMQLNSSGSSTELVVNGSSVTLGGGTLTLSNNANNFIVGAATADKLTNKETIQGAGNIGDGQMALLNAGTINANQSAGLAIQANGGFANNGTLLVGSSDKMHVFGGTFSNFASGTLTGGTYNTAGTLQIDPLGTAGGEIVTNAAKIILNGTTSGIVDASGLDALKNFATNASAGAFTLSGKHSIMTAGNFSNAGNVTISAGSTFTVGGTGVYTQTAGTTTDSGILSAPGGVSMQAGSLIGVGSITGNFSSSGIVTPGTSATKTGILKETGTYTQNAGGAFNVSIAGTTVGTNYDQFKPTAANLGGTLNITNLNGFVPTIGSTFDILHSSSVTGKFATVNGLSINTGEHYAITYTPTDVELTVVTGPSAALRSFGPQVSDQVKLSGLSAQYSDRFGQYSRAALQSMRPTVQYASAAIQSTSPAVPSTRSALQPIAAAFKSIALPAAVAPPVATYAQSSFRVHDAFAAMAVHRAPTASSNALSARPMGSSPPRLTSEVRPRFGSKVGRGNLQFSLPTLFSRPRVDFSLN